MNERTSKNRKKVSTKNFFALLKKLKWPIGVTVVALILSLSDNDCGTRHSAHYENACRYVGEMHYSIGKQRLFYLSSLLCKQFTGGVSHYLLTYIGETIVADLRGKLWNKVLRLTCLVLRCE